MFNYQRTRIKNTKEKIKAEEERIQVGKNVVALAQEKRQLAEPYLKKADSLTAQKVKDIAQMYSLNVISDVKETAAEQELYTTLAYEVVMDCKYHNLGKFISAIESLSDIIEIKRLHIIKKAQGDDSQDVPAESVNKDDAVNITAEIKFNVIFLK